MSEYSKFFKIFNIDESKKKLGISATTPAMTPYFMAFKILSLFNPVGQDSKVSSLELAASFCSKSSFSSGLSLAKKVEPIK